MADEKGSSLRPSEFSEGTGLLDDVDVVIAGAKFSAWDYNGKSVAVPAAIFTLKDDDGEDHEQALSAGKLTEWQPSRDGKRLLPVGKNATININSNFGQWMVSLINAGYPEEKLSDDITALIGLKVHVKRVPAPERKGMNNQKADATILTVTKVFEETIEAGAKAVAEAAAADAKKPPSQRGGKGKKTEAAPKEEAAPQAAGEDEMTMLINKMVELLDKQPGKKINKTGIPRAILPVLAGVPNATKLMARAFEDSFLAQGAELGFWTYADGMVTLNE